MKLALGWLREDLIYRREYEKSIDKRRGAREETTDSEVFYSKFDYVSRHLNNRKRHLIIKNQHSGSRLYILCYNNI